MKNRTNRMFRKIYIHYYQYISFYYSINLSYYCNVTSIWKKDKTFILSYIKKQFRTLLAKY